MPSRYQFTLFDLLLAVLAWGAGATACFTSAYISDAFFLLVIWALAVLGGSALGLQIANGLGISGGLKRCAILALSWVYIPAALVTLWCAVVMGGCLVNVLAILLSRREGLEHLDELSDDLSYLKNCGLMLLITVPLVFYVWRLNKAANAAYQLRASEHL